MEHTAIRWTPRQREVLGLLARGHTNPEIARELGISLDGAKWHVSEVMSILGVPSREAAAAYWRRENRLPVRFVRSLRGLAFGPALRWSTATVGAIAVVTVFVALLLATRGDDDAGQALPDTTETPAPSTPTPGQPTAAPTAATPAPTAAAIGQINGEPVYELVPAPARELPAGSVLYTTISCAVCVGGELHRFAEDDTGEWAREKLSPDSMPGIEGGYPVGSFVSDGAGRFAALWCIPDPKGCGKTHDGTPDTRDRAVILSEDGGLTWRQTGTVAAGSSVIQFVGEQVVVAERSVSGEDAEYRQYPSGTPFDPAVLVQHDTGTVLPGGLLRLQTEVGTNRLANEGSSVWSYLRAGSNAGELLAFPGGHLSLTVAVGRGLVAGGSFGRNDKAQLLDPPRELGGFPRIAVLVDLQQRTVSPIADISGDDPNDFFDPAAFLPGPILRVTGAGDCLNLREAPDTSSPVLKCFADGVFFVDSGERRDADGQAWAKVTGPGGVLGWASLHYLTPVGPR